MAGTPIVRVAAGTSLWYKGLVQQMLCLVAKVPSSWAFLEEGFESLPLRH